MEKGRRVTKVLPRSQAAGQTFEAPPPAPSTVQPTEYALVGPNGEQRMVRGVDAANALLSQGWRRYDATSVRNDPARAQLVDTQVRRANDGLAIIKELVEFDNAGNVKKTHPGLDRAFGTIQGAIPDFHQDSVNVRAAVDRLKSLVTLPEMQSLRGLGPASDRDVRIVEHGATTLGNARLGDADVRAELKRIYDALSRLAVGGDGGGESAQTPPVESPGRGAAPGPGPRANPFRR